MKIIKPYYKILSPIDGLEILKNIERAGRTCYKSEDKLTEDSSIKFVKMIIARGHESVLEHEKMSVLFVCDRGVSHEIVRHRIASFSQESTRYCNYAADKFDNQLTFILPTWINEGIKYYTNLRGFDGDWEKLLTEEQIWLRTMWQAEENYNKLIAGGWQAQQARSILPNSLKTEIVVTANFREWRTIFKQRCSIAAHPQMRELMCPLLDEMKRKIPALFADIKF